MNDTRLTLSPEQEKRLAQPYAFGGKPAARWTFDVLAGCGALYSTVDDMLVFLSAELGVLNTRLRPAMDATQEPRRETGVKGLRIGLGWLIRKPTKPEQVQRELIWHNGGTAGYSSFVGFVKETKTAVVVLANTGPSLGVPGAADLIGMGVLRVLDQKTDPK
jgi:CubicO group peptidase (beta-lactamase class C family)